MMSSPYYPKEMSLKIGTLLLASMFFMVEAISATVIAEPPQLGNKAIIQVSLLAPSSNWRVHISQVVQHNDKLVVIADLSRQDALGAQVITEISDQVILNLPALPVETFVRGKTWQWENQEPYKFLAPGVELPFNVDTGSVVFQREH